MQSKLTCFFFLWLMVFSSTVSHALKNEDNFLVISDIHLDYSLNHTMEFQPSTYSNLNDLDLHTFQEIMINLRKSIDSGLIPKPKFILLLGDLIGHQRVSFDFVLKNEAIVFHEIKRQFAKTPILYTFGNNDSLETDYGPFTSLNTQNKYRTPLDIAHAQKHWSNSFLSTGITCSTTRGIFPCIISENKKNGYYSVYLENGFRLISLNTVIFSSQRNNIDMEDIVEQFRWFQRQLTKVEKNNETVLISMHILPGQALSANYIFWDAEAEITFLKLIKQYHRSIIGVLAGHTHYDEIKSIQDITGQPLVGIYVNGGLSTSHGNAPSVRTYYYSKLQKKWQLTNYEVFFFKKNRRIISLHKLYDYLSHYCNDNTSTTLKCLENLTLEKINTYFTAGNENFNVTNNLFQNAVITIENIRRQLS